MFSLYVNYNAVILTQCSFEDRMRLQSYQGLQLGILLAVLEDRRFAEQPVQPPENLKVFLNFYLYSLFV